MRIQLIIGILVFVTAFSTVSATPELDGGVEKKSGTDSVAVLDNADASSDGVVIRRINISAADVNPDFGKVARWDTSDINMYHVDMTQFSDTLVYSFQSPVNGMNYTVPKVGRVTSGFGYRRLFGRKFHKGLDIDLETGDVVVAALGGKIRIARYGNGYGNFVVISHKGGLETLYGHLSELSVKEGDDIASGQQIGLGGSTGQSTGSHLHFEIRVFGEQVDPAWVLDPNTLMPYTAIVKIDKSWFAHLQGMTEVPVHIVAAGETLDVIAAMYEMDRTALIQLNGLDAITTEVVEGTRLKLE